MASNIKDGVVNSDWPLDALRLNVDYIPWLKKDRWKSVGCEKLKKGSPVSISGLRYSVVDNDSKFITDETSTFQVLRVCWIKKYGRSSYGFCVQLRRTHEIVAMIQQDEMRANFWEFKCKYMTHQYQKLEGRDGWLRVNLLVNIMNSVFYHLLKK